MTKHLAAVIAALLSILGISATASAQERFSERSLGYVYGNLGQVSRDNTGDCVRTNLWTPELAIAECDPDLVKKPEVAAVAEPAPLAAFETVTLETITLFDFDKDDLRPEGRQKLDRLIERMRDKESAGEIAVVGHADATGTVEYNQGLSERRAASVMDYLVQNGVSQDLIQTRGMSENQPIATNETREGRQLNRRVEIEAPVQRPREQ